MLERLFRSGDSSAVEAPQTQETPAPVIEIRTVQRPEREKSRNQIIEREANCLDDIFADLINEQYRFAVHI